MGSKSWENFLSLLHRSFWTYALTENALDYLRALKYPQKWLRVLQRYVGVSFLSHDAWKACMKGHGLTGKRRLQQASEALVYACLMEHGLGHLTTFSDGAQQFNVLSLAVIEEKLILMLEDPSLPLHNNRSDSLIREYVKRRKIRGGTQSEAGRQSRDTFASLKKTCRLYGLSFRDYLTDRLNGIGLFPRLSGIIENASFLLPGLSKVIA